MSSIFNTINDDFNVVCLLKMLLYNIFLSLCPAEQPTLNAVTDLLVERFIFKSVISE